MKLDEYILFATDKVCIPISEAVPTESLGLRVGGVLRDFHPVLGTGASVLSLREEVCDFKVDLGSLLCGEVTLAGGLCWVLPGVTWAANPALSRCQRTPGVVKIVTSTATDIILSLN